ncbi:hypothetical protein [Paenibacillus sacheonensis]|uniref:Uncharacterized protein n=1 Tax=Paenibacillus sacheonensis TaxID=742054 RepID=A0A7X4YTU7_9BACL|nr:hypothetical protein [Paenibacillus sacheonensis]MBM7568648.1 hypothetical protein [Paenibacillus sacheonensis]NBC72461.1 hypothetical protein [Paenibacillus sacheonensis]
MAARTIRTPGKPKKRKWIGFNRAALLADANKIIVLVENEPLHLTLTVVGELNRLPNVHFIELTIVSDLITRFFALISSYPPINACHNH